jgi:hypothetical protein
LNPANNQINAADLAKMTIRGMALSSGGAQGFDGNWSHAKLFAVLNATDQQQSIAMIGGQNHWVDYFEANRPFDASYIMQGDWSRAPSYALDGAIAVFSLNWGARNPRYYVYNPPNAPTQGAAVVPIMGLSARGVMRNAANLNINVGNPAANAIAMVDMGNYQRRNTGTDRSIFNALGAITQAQRPQNNGNTIFAWQQSFCNSDTGNCGGRWRHWDTFIHSVAEHIVNPAELAVAANKIRMLWAGNSVTLSRYNGGNPRDTAVAFFNNAAWTACTESRRFPLGRRTNLLAFANGTNNNRENTAASRATNYAGIRFRNLNCRQAAWRLEALRSQGRTARANDATNRLVAAGEHHKIYVFDYAALVSSFNAYPTTNTALAGGPDSALIENGLWTFTNLARAQVMGNAENAWSVAAAVPQWGNPTGANPP